MFYCCKTNFLYILTSVANPGGEQLGQRFPPFCKVKKKVAAEGDQKIHVCGPHLYPCSGSATLTNILLVLEFKLIFPETVMSWIRTMFGINSYDIHAT